ncbi:SEC23-interacting protein isoform X2 [Microcaecilia unicolor]|uniref:SEC23-interacting protein isoform X2 n=1 Tax=Microcaecilia unicolor TaxID=1415580 RepID=A0A6P7Y0W8_9AMPH|nr:SEC23-interacting protein isoform X2 [Microcaecilia unicolor]
MADKRLNGSSATNLLFSSATDFSFSVPFIPVSQPAESAVLPADDSTEVGEEDSFLGQTSANTSQPQTFSYFSSQVSSTSSDPFANIGQASLSAAAGPVRGLGLFSKPATTGPQNGQSVFSTPVPKAQPMHAVPPASQFGTGPYQMPPQNCPAPAASQQGYNPYRHNTLSSRANPYITPPQLQQGQSLGSPLQPQSSAPPTHMYPSVSMAESLPSEGPPLLPPPMQSPPGSQPAGLVQAPPYFIQNQYEPVQPHWFYCKQVECKQIWLPFSVLDSEGLERLFNSVQPDPESVIISTDGGRYDVYLYDRCRKAVYWEEETSEVRRCTWFYKGDTDSRFVPYSEEFGEKLEAEYKKAVTSNQWHRRLEFPGGETIVMHNPKVIVQFQPSAIPDEWGTTQDGQARPRVVKRGIDDEHDDIPDGEMPLVDHLVFMVHGIGPVCDLRFRSIVECVDDFRAVSLKLLRTHFKKSLEERRISRVEFLPVHWHSSLHGDATGVDRNIKKISLPSIGRLRHFTNETLLDILFYNSPTYCQTIVDKVSMEMNRLHALFTSRNPDFKGGVSVVGHSLGSLILFDILSNQTDLVSAPAVPPESSAVNGPQKVESTDEKAAEMILQSSLIPGGEVENPEQEEEEMPALQSTLAALSLSEYCSTFEEEKMDMESLLMCTMDDLKEMGIPLGPRKKIAKFVKERAAKQEQRKAAREKKAAEDALKKAQEEANRRNQEQVAHTGSSGLAQQQRRMLPGGSSVASVHVDYEYFEVGTGQVSVVYCSLDFKPEMFFAMGSPVGMFLTVRGKDKINEDYRLPTCRGFFNIYHPLDPVAYRIEPMIIPDLDLKPVLVPHHKGRKRLHLELKESLSRMGSDLKHGFISSLRSAWQTLNDFARAHTSSPQLQVELEKVANQIKEEEEKQQVEAQKIVESPESSREDDSSVKVGKLNGGKRIDYVLQEKPIESFNEYLFALQSHLCYWESEDTALLILKEIYKTLNISPEQPQH